jgi:glycosyltransferase involved in cell wall biosynthesis
MTAPVLLYLVTEDWYFLSHRLPMAMAAKNAGYEVHVATRVVQGREAIEAHGFHLHSLDWRRGSFNPLARLAIWREVRSLYRRVSPALAHHVALEPTIIGSLAAFGLPIVCLNALAGLGFAFTSRTLKARLTGGVVGRLLALLLNRPRAAALVQNGDDRAALASLGVKADRIFVIPGSGVDTQVLTPLPDPTGPITVAFVGRLLDDKGIRTLIAAQARLAKSDHPVRLLIAGEPDPANPGSIPPGEIGAWRERKDVSVLGYVDDIRQVWAAAHIAVLPSRREGLPKSLLEAAACGRALVATDVPGCREVAREGLNAHLVPADDPIALAEAIADLAHDADKRRRFALASRKLVEQEFSASRVGEDIVALYAKLLGRGPLRQSMTSS